jgi:hypothetical protein
MTKHLTLCLFFFFVFFKGEDVRRDNMMAGVAKGHSRVSSCNCICNNVIVVAHQIFVVVMMYIGVNA